MQKIYEWLVRVGNKDFYLTDKQHATLISSKQEGIKMVVYKNFTINPSFVEYTCKQTSQRTTKVCVVCGGLGGIVKTTNGNTVGTEVCNPCKGLGRIPL